MIGSLPLRLPLALYLFPMRPRLFFSMRFSYDLTLVFSFDDGDSPETVHRAHRSRFVEDGLIQVVEVREPCSPLPTPMGFGGFSPFRSPGTFFLKSLARLVQKKPSYNRGFNVHIRSG